MKPLFLIPVFVLTTLFLFYYLYKDIKYREINVLPLYVMAVISFAYNFFFTIKYGIWSYYLLQILFTFIFLTILYIFGKITIFAYIGEGDLITIMFISITSGFGLLFAPLVFLGALFLVLIIPLILFIYNLLLRNFGRYGFTKNVCLMFLGYPLALSKINNFHTPLEKFEEKDKKLRAKTNFRPNPEPKEELITLKKIAKKHKIKRVWVSPLLPFIVPIFISYLIFTILFFFKIFNWFSETILLYI